MSKLNFKARLIETGTLYHNDEFNFNLRVDSCETFSPVLKCFPHVVVRDVFGWFVERHLNLSQLQDYLVHVNFEMVHSVPKHDGYLEVDALNPSKECFIWLRHTKSFKNQLKTLIHELIHFKHYLNFGLPVSNEEEAYENEERLLTEYLEQPYAKVFLKSFGLTY